MNTPMVSICIPVYNGSNTIRETLMSAMTQSYQNVEILVIDNKSIDNTVDIVCEIADERVRVFQNTKNLGMAGNWNECIKKAMGKYIHFLCADDLLSEDCIEEKVKLMEKDETIQMVISSTQIIDEKNNVLLTRRRYKKNCILDGKKLAKKSFYVANLYGEPSNVMFRRDLIAKTGIFATNTCYTTDWDLWLRISVQGKVGYIDKCLTQYRISNTNETSSMQCKKFLEDDKVFTENILAYNCLKVGRTDIAIHQLMYIIRMYARMIFMKLKSK